MQFHLNPYVAKNTYINLRSSPKWSPRQFKEHFVKAVIAPMVDHAIKSAYFCLY